MTAYKLLTQDMQSHGGLQWTIGCTHTAQEHGNKMCSPQVLHCYSHPLMAAMFNPIHANIDNPRLFEIEASEIINQDFAKLACKSQMLVKEIPLPTLSDEQRQEVAIRCAMLIPGAPLLWTNWAKDWLSGKDRTLELEKLVYAYAHARARACAYAYAYAHACACARACAHAYAHAHAHACACARARAYARACAYTYAFSTQEQILTFLQNLK